MAITINWPTGVINVPKADLTLIQASPEVRQIDLNWFRMQLKDLEDSDDGMIFPYTHNHNTEVTLSGLTYARIVEITNGYTVEFEDGQYTINCVGANHNLADVKVANQVSLIVNNAAGLISNAQIEYSSFNGGISVDLTSPYSGTMFPIGTPQQPVNNFTDALLIAQVRGFSVFYITGDATISDSLDFEGFVFIGESQTKTTLDIDANAQVNGCEFYDATIQGTLDGDTKLKNCTVNTLNYINGIVEQCLLEPGVITLGGNAEAHFLDCWTGGANPSSTPTIDMGGSGQSLILRNYNGGIAIRNKNGSDPISIDLNSGKIKLESTVTAGTVTIRGVGCLEDQSSGTTIDATDLVSVHSLADGVWDEPTSEHLEAGSYGLGLNNNFAFMAEMLGLTQSNMFQDQCSYQVYQNQNFLTSARIRTYTQAASVGTDNDVLATYLVTVTWNNDQMLSYQVVKQ
jgi:hypothetical protein